MDTPTTRDEIRAAMQARMQAAIDAGDMVRAAKWARRLQDMDEGMGTFGMFRRALRAEFTDEEA